MKRVIDSFMVHISFYEFWVFECFSGTVRGLLFCLFYSINIQMMVSTLSSNITIIQYWKRWGSGNDSSCSWREIESYPLRQESCLSTRLDCVYRGASASAFFFFFFEKRVSDMKNGSSVSCALFTGPTNLFFQQNFH